MIAVINGNQPLVELLINNGADIKIRSEFGKNIYDMATSMDRRVRVYVEFTTKKFSFLIILIYTYNNIKRDYWNILMRST